MGQASFAADKPAIVVSEMDNVVPFDARRRASGAHSGSTARQIASEGVVVHLPPRSARQAASRAEKSITKTRAEFSGSDAQRFTPFDLVATAFLILSVFAGPALVWTLLRSASFG